MLMGTQLVVELPTLTFFRRARCGSHKLTNSLRCRPAEPIADCQPIVGLGRPINEDAIHSGVV